MIPDECRALVWIDPEPVIQKKKQNCLELMARIDAARETLRRFNEDSQPAFEQWLYSSFGKEITAIRELNSRYEIAEMLIGKIQNYRNRNRCSYTEAYLAVHSRKRRTTSSVREPRNRNHSREQAESTQSSPIDQEARGGFRTHSDDSLTVQDQDHLSRLKRLYIGLVRRLHPDKNPHLDERQKNLWHQVQEAYDAKDLERLETLTSMNELHFDQGKRIEDVESLGTIFEELKAALKQLQKEINRCKKELSWNFEKIEKNSKRLSTLYRKVSLDLESSRSELEERLDYCTQIIKSWSVSAKSDGLRNRSKTR